MNVLNSFPHNCLERVAATASLTETRQATQRVSGIAIVAVFNEELELVLEVYAILCVGVLRHELFNASLLLRLSVGSDPYTGSGRATSGGKPQYMYQTVKADPSYVHAPDPPKRGR